MDLVSIIVIVFCLIFGPLVLFKIDLIEKIRNTFYPYPLSSKSGDKMFPDKQNVAGWAEYILLSIFFIIVIVQIFLMILNSSYDPPLWVGMVLAMTMMFAGVSHKFSEEFNKDKKPDES